MMKINGWIVMIMCSLLVLVACQSTNDHVTSNNDGGNTNLAVEDDFPLTVKINEEAIKIEEQPEKVMPLSLEMAEIVLDLVEPDKVVATTRGVDDPLLSSKGDLAKTIDARIQAASNIDPEEIIAYDTDLLIMTKMYGQEEDAKKTLDALQVPILAFDSILKWEDFMEAYAIVGKALGKEKQAEENIADMQAGIRQIQADIPEDDHKPSLLVLSEVGGVAGPFMMGPTNISYDLIQLAGAEPAVDAVDLSRSGPAAMEQIIKMDPDYILFVDFFGKGESGFEDLINDPSWQTLSAVQAEQINILDAKYVINPNPELIEGLRHIVDWLYDH